MRFGREPSRSVTALKPGLAELQWQISAQYRFRWLSGDDGVQPLAHNLGRTTCWPRTQRIDLPISYSSHNTTPSERADQRNEVLNDFTISISHCVIPVPVG